MHLAGDELERFAIQQERRVTGREGVLRGGRLGRCEGMLLAERGAYCKYYTYQSQKISIHLSNFYILSMGENAHWLIIDPHEDQRFAFVVLYAFDVFDIAFYENAF
jgi:hypothetical protein